MKIAALILFVFKVFLAVSAFVVFKYMSKNIQRGFICGDPSLSLNQKPDTIPNLAVVIWGASPILIVAIGEFIIKAKKFSGIKSILKKSSKNVKFLFHRYAVNLLMINIFMSAVKFFAAAHRPHFFETCKPDTMFNCTEGTFVPSYTCTNHELPTWKILDSSWSFFSGHASNIVFSSFFVIWYLEKRMKRSSLFALLFAQILIASLSFYGAFSRILDHRHHWWDVLVGSIVGLITTYHTCYISCQNRCSKNENLELPSDVNRNLVSPMTVKVVEE